MQRSNSGLPIRKMLPGVHRIRAQRKACVVEYWYAWRGGPPILIAKARSADELARLVESKFAEAATAYKAAMTPQTSEDFLSGLVAKYLASAEFKKLGARTRDDLTRHLGKVRDGLGTMPVEALKSEKARKILLDWRDQWKATPKTADARLGALALVLSWAKRRGDLSVNPLEKWPRLYSVNRAEVIWTKADLVTLLKGADADFRRAVLFAAFSGLRLGDLVRVTWADVGEKAITLTTAKSRGKRVVIVPITPKLQAILKQIGRKDVGAVLTHSRGLPWTAWGIQTAMQRRKTAKGVKGLRFHDLRGTAATHFARSLPLADVARIMGWTPQRVDAIAARYVTAEAVAEGMLKRLKGNK